MRKDKSVSEKAGLVDIFDSTSVYYTEPRIEHALGAGKTFFPAPSACSMTDSSTHL
jgi:hypothetical protein